MGRYGLLGYRGCRNLGDEIQSIAAERFLPRVDRLVNRDELHLDTRSTEPLFLLMNGWFGNPPDRWPPHPSIHPVLVSFHLARAELADPRFASFYRRHEPIGCRDLATAARLQAIGVEAYFSGCLTLTLRNEHPVRGGGIYMVDVPESLERHIPSPIREAARRVTHRVGLPAGLERKTSPATRGGLARFWLRHAPFLQSWKARRARALLERYMRAKLVITSRLHCALPCLAFGTPTVVLRESWHDPRWMGYGDLVNTYSARTISRLDWDGIPVRSASALAEQLEARARQALSAFQTGHAIGMKP